MAGDALPHVTAPTLLIVGSRDRQVIDLNRLAFERLAAPRDMVIVEGAGHLFEEPGKLAEVERHAVRWFRQHLAGEGGQ
jgi:pimeloyl-ACP methyl ester carboxylesterase